MVETKDDDIFPPGLLAELGYELIDGITVEMMLAEGKARTTARSCSWCDRLNPVEIEICECGHFAQVPRSDCACEMCAPVMKTFNCRDCGAEVSAMTDGLKFRLTRCFDHALAYMRALPGRAISPNGEEEKRDGGSTGD
jgi:hypothetical protein